LLGVSSLVLVTLAGCGAKKVGDPVSGRESDGQGDAGRSMTPPDAIVVTGSDAEPAGPGPMNPPPAALAARKTPTHGSAIAISADDKWAVAANRTAGRVSVFKLDFGGVTPANRTADVDVGGGSEPWAVVIGNDDNSAYVILRREQEVVRIKDLRSNPTVDGRAKTGSEPTGIAISPTGARLYVANWAEGTVSVINSSTMAVTRTVDLNAALAKTGWLGTVEPRPGLAHPRALVVTNDGDGEDTDERLYVTEFFAQARTVDSGDESVFDINRQGAVYSIATGSWEVAAPIKIAPVTDTGFADSSGRRTGCFPNQLYAAALNAGKLYVTSVCESPRGPTVNPAGVTANFKTQVHAAVFVIDTSKDVEIPEQGLLLTREFDRMFAARGVRDDASRRMPLIPNDIMFAAGTTVGYVSGYGSDAVYRIAYKADGSLDQVGAMSQPFIDLKPAGGKITAGELPIGIASANAGASKVSFALALNESTRNLSVLSFGIQSTVAAVSATDPPSDPADVSRNKGRKFFVTGLGRWSLNGQAWNSCEACHPDGMTDNVTWFFARGPRQTVSLDASYDPQNPLRRRVLNWTGIFDEIHDFELNTRGNSGGVGAIVHTVGPPVQASDRIVFDGTAFQAPQQVTTTPQAGLNGAASSLMPASGAGLRSALSDWDDIDAYVKTIRSPRAPSNLDANAVAEGKKLFEANHCAACHGGSHWTIAQVFYTPGDDNNSAQGLLRSTRYTLPANFPPTLNPPAAAGLGRASLRFSASTDPAVIGANDQINCVLRDVGTYPTSGNAGVAPSGVLVREVRQDMSTAAQGATGFNIPSLLGMVTGAPYFHAGAARTLEEALDDVFARHHRALSENFTPSPVERQQLAAYLLSIDEETAPVTPPTVQQLGFPYDLCQQTVAGVIR
jgi:YVTN family beta-propeller protein